MLAYGALRYAQKTGQSMPVYAKLDQTIKNWETKHNWKSALEPQPMRAPPPEPTNPEVETTSSGLPLAPPPATDMEEAEESPCQSQGPDETDLKEAWEVMMYTRMEPPPPPMEAPPPEAMAIPGHPMPTTGMSSGSDGRPSVYCVAAEPPRAPSMPIPKPAKPAGARAHAPSTSSSSGAVFTGKPWEAPAAGQDGAEALLAWGRST